MIHLGDITKIHGYTAPIVDCIIGGSPCQDLSTAGARAGFSGKRSVLFLDQIRVTKEMRHCDRASGRTGELIRPRYMVWENVPGAFSSNGGRDFQSVLTETVRVVEPEAPVVPMPKNGWPTSGCLMGDGWSVAWRVLDAQFWGVPQRRRRIALVADFGGQSAPEILFVRKGLSGDSEPGSEERKGPAGSPESGAAYAVRIRGGCDGGGKGALVQTEISGTLGCNNDQTVFCLQVIRVKKTVRRLTPLECERLQGFPDGWTDIGPWTDRKGKIHKKSSDRIRYKALGNSIALPPWKWVLKRICAQYERDATMASLFDGIGGFPLLWEQLNGKGSCLWASEIEEFPMAVTRMHFG